MDYQQIVDEILAILSSEGDPDLDVISARNSDLVAAVDGVNKRLRRCDELLQKGHRAEALELCEVEPNLLDAVGVLDFMELAYWIEYISELKLPVPQELLSDVAAELNDAYTALMSIEKLLQQYRLKSLARSPLRVRLPLLRQIAHQDAENPLWQEDLKTFETARRRELATELQVAKKRVDVQALASIERELKTTPWVSRAQAKLVEEAEEAHTEARQREAQTGLQQAADALHAAWQEQDAPAGQSARMRWEALLRIAELPEGDALFEQAEPALQWLDGIATANNLEDAFRAAVAALEHGIDSEVSRMNLERLCHAALKYERELPESLRYRYSERMRYLEESARRRSRMIWGGLILTTLLIGGGVIYMINEQQFARELDGHLKTFAGFIEQGKLDEADRYCSDRRDLDPSVYRVPAFQKLVGDLADARRVEDGRKAQLAAAMSTAKNSGLSNPTFDSVELALKELVHAEKEIAKGPAELAEIKKLQNEIITARNQLQTRINEQFGESLRRITAAMESLSVEEPAAVARLLDESKTLLGTPRVDPNLISDLKLCIERLSGMHETALEMVEDSDRLKKLTAAVGKLEPFTAGLKEYIATVPADSSGRSRDFQELLNHETQYWQGATKWNLLQTQLASLNVQSLTPEAAQTSLDRGLEFRMLNPSFPSAASLAPLLDHLKAATNRSPSKRLVSDLAEILETKPVAGIYALRTRKPQWYYGPGAPTRSDNSQPFQMRYYSSLQLNASSLGTVTVPAVDVLTVAAEGGQLDWAAPQWQFSRRVLPSLKSLDPTEWEVVFGEAISDLMADDAMDPVLKVQLAFKLLEAVSKGSDIVKREVERDLLELTKLFESLSAETNWLDPANSQGNAFRQQSVAALKTIEGLVGLQTRALEKLQELNDGDWRISYQWVGWIYRDHYGKWLCPLRDVAPDVSNELFVFHGSGNMQLVRIASLNDGKAKLDETSSALKEGRAVFLIDRRKPPVAGE